MRKTTKLLGAIFGILWALPVWGACYDYTSATGTVSQFGTPTPDNPIYPTFYTQGNMVLRKVGNIADSYDATTGKITRRVGEYIFTGRESIDTQYNVYGVTTIPYDMNKVTNASLCSHNKTYVNNQVTSIDRTFDKFLFFTNVNKVGFGLSDTPPEITNTETFKQWLAAQYAAGTPVKIYYPLDTEVVEDWTGTQWCDKIEIATTKYNETKFSPLNTALQNAISVVDTVVTQTITQAGRIADLQTQKQTRPADDPSDANNAENCPAGKKCLLVEDASGIPHWYEIVENAWDLPAGYTQLEYLRSDGRAYINTNYSPTSKTRIEVVAKADSGAGNINIVGSGHGTTGTSDNALLVINSLNDNTAEIKFDPARSWIKVENVNMLEKTRLSLSATKFSVNDDVKETNNTTIPDTDNQPFYIFQRWRPSIVSTNDKTQVYEFSIYENDILVRNFVPAKRNSDGVFGMYDLVSGQFFTNAGTGEFIAGPVAE